MELGDFHSQTRARVRLTSQQIQDAAEPYPYEETIFAEIVMQHMADVGMTEEPIYRI